MDWMRSAIFQHLEHETLRLYDAFIRHISLRTVVSIVLCSNFKHKNFIRNLASNLLKSTEFVSKLKTHLLIKYILLSFVELKVDFLNLCISSNVEHWTETKTNEIWKPFYVESNYYLLTLGDVSYAHNS